MGTWSIQGNNAYIQSSSVTGDNLSVVFKPNSGNTQQGSAQNFTITYNDNGNVTTTSYTLPYCYVPAPEPEVQYTFNVDFDGLSEGFSHDNLGKTYTIRVTSGTRSDSSAPYVWQPVSYNFSKTLSNNASFGLIDKGQQGGDQTVHGYLVVLNGTPNNTAVSDIKLAITQNDSNNHSEQTFNFMAEETPTYYNEIRPYILECTYMKGENMGGSNYYLHFKSYEGVNGISVNKKVTFFADLDDKFVSFADGSNCGGNSEQRPTRGHEPYLESGEKDTFNCQVTPSDNCLSTASDRGLFLRFVSQECKGQNNFYENFYNYDDTNISFKGENSSVILGCKGDNCPIDSMSYDDGSGRSVWLSIPKKAPGQTGIDIVKGPDILVSSNLIFNAPNGQTTVSVYEDGAVFVDDAPEGVATVNEHFQNITQFVQQIYPNNSYTSIESCSLFNGVNLDEHCINDIVIEDGELIRRDESIPSPTRAMHIELEDDNNN